MDGVGGMVVRLKKRMRARIFGAVAEKGRKGA